MGIIWQFLWVRNSEAAELRSSGSASLMRLQSRYQFELQSDEGLSGAGELLTRQLIHMAGKLEPVVGGKPRRLLMWASQPLSS